MADFSYRVIRSSRRTLALEITPTGEVLVRCPRRCSNAQIAAFVQSKADWLQKHLAKRAARPQLPPLTAEEVQSLTQQALQDLPVRVARFAALVGVAPLYSGTLPNESVSSCNTEPSQFLNVTVCSLFASTINAPSPGASVNV